ncbi:MAG: hypothetical protein P1P77_04220 [Spirochaetaceae bacterium]|nr:hypothetical protein [Spirochaetaceae bacterium]
MMFGSVYDDGMRTSLKDVRSLWWYAGMMVAGIATLYLSWSADGLDEYLASGSAPKTFSATVFVSAAFLFGLGGAFTLDRVSREPGHPFVRWIRYTPVSPAAYLAERFLFHLVHSLFLLILIWPSLFLAAAAAQVPLTTILSVAAYLGFLSLCLRLIAEAGRRLDRPTGPLGFLVYVIAVVSFSLFVNASFPKWSFVQAMGAIMDPARDAHALVVRTCALHAATVIPAMGIFLVRLRITERIEAAN